YALALGASNLLIALLSTLPGLLGNLNQLTTLNLIKKQSRKSIVMTAVILQALLWIPLIGLGIWYMLAPDFRKTIPLFLLFVYSFLIMSGSSGSPAWNSWMRDLVLKNSGRYFGMRNRIMHICIIFSMFVASGILTFFKTTTPIIGFCIIFAIAGAARLISAFFLLRQYEPKFKYSDEAYFSFYDFVKKMLFNNFGRFVLLVSLISLATNFAGPFFAVYMLQELQFSYVQFTFVSTAALVSMIFFLPRWGDFADKFGNVRVMQFNAILIALIPLLWFASIFFSSLSIWFIVFYLVALELYSGYAWAGFNLSAGNFIYDAVTKERMAFCVAYFNIINAFCAFVGAILGAFIASQKIQIFGIEGLVLLFLLSFIGRCLVAIYMQTAIREVRQVSDFKLKEHIKQKLKEGKFALNRFIGLASIRNEHFEYQ
ncbi:MAG: MFS transporter, partial [Nanoarchaeota archaeon]